MEAPSIIFGGLILLMATFAITAIAVLTSIFIIVLLNKILPILAYNSPKHIPYKITWIVGVATFVYCIYIFYFSEPYIFE